MNFLTFFLAFDSWIDLFLLILGVIVKFFWIFLQCLCDQVAPAETPKQPDLSTNNRPHSSCEVQHDSGLGHYGPIGHYSYPDLTRASRCASLPRTVADVSSLTISNPWEIPHNVTATAPLFENSGVEEREKISPRSKVRLNLPFVPRLYLSSIRPILLFKNLAYLWEQARNIWCVKPCQMFKQQLDWGHRGGAKNNFRFDVAANGTVCRCLVKATRKNCKPSSNLLCPVKHSPRCKTTTWSHCS